MNYLPAIKKDDFEAFAKFMGNYLPDSYNKWLKLCSEWLADPTLQPFIEVEIDPDEFEGFSVGQGRRPDINALSIFATNIGKSKAGTP
jgi:hypothetical protein